MIVGNTLSVIEGGTDDMTAAAPHEPTNLDVIHRLGGAAALLHPLRRRILSKLQQGDSAAGLSKRLGIPRQKLNYHLRELEREGLVELVEERRKGNCVERVMRATARAYVLSPRLLGMLAARPEQIEDRFSSAYLTALAANAVEELGLLRARAGRAGKRLATLSLQTRVRFADPAARQAFTEELTRRIAELVAEYHDEQATGGRTFKFFVGGYPEIAPEAEGESMPDDGSRGGNGG